MSAKRAERLNLRARNNPACRKCLNRDERKEFLEQDLCRLALSVLDEMSLRCVGDWAYDKIFRLSQYFGTFVQGMHKRWRGLTYIEICSGPGRCLIRETAEEIDGTSLAIINNPRSGYLGSALFIDINPEAIAILNERIKVVGAYDKARAVIGDYTDAKGIISLLQELPADRLNLVFIDPTECDVPFSTVEAIITSLENVDLLINVSIGTDISRNIGRVVLESSFAKAREKYESFLGDKGFFVRPDVIHAAELGQADELRKLFAEAYKSKLFELGYVYSDARAVKHYYYLLFASRNTRGLDFWNRSCSYDPQGQREFLFED